MHQTDLGLNSDSEFKIAEFDGTWRADCFENRIFMVPEEAQPDGYTQTTLTIDSGTNAYSESRQIYLDSQCILEDPDSNARVQSGDILFEGILTTDTGLEATLVLYFNKGTVPDLTGLLYREGDILYRDVRQSTVIEDGVPGVLSLSNPWQLVN